MGTSGAISRLYIANANKKDSGNYSCALADVAAATTSTDLADFSTLLREVGFEFFEAGCFKGDCGSKETISTALASRMNDLLGNPVFVNSLSSVKNAAENELLAHVISERRVMKLEIEEMSDFNELRCTDIHLPCGNAIYRNNTNHVMVQTCMNDTEEEKKDGVGGLILENEQLAQLTPTRGDKRLATGVLGPGNETSLGSSVPKLKLGENYPGRINVGLWNELLSNYHDFPLSFDYEMSHLKNYDDRIADRIDMYVNVSLKEDYNRFEDDSSASKTWSVCKTHYRITVRRQSWRTKISKPDRARERISEGNSSLSREVKRSKAVRLSNSERKLETRLDTTFIPTANQPNDNPFVQSGHPLYAARNWMKGSALAVSIFTTRRKDPEESFPQDHRTRSYHSLDNIQLYNSYPVMQLAIMQQIITIAQVPPRGKLLRQIIFAPPPTSLKRKNSRLAKASLFETRPTGSSQYKFKYNNQ
ncbi:hypothetical protein WN51_10307 [Melipona quadrifasciata]|uniref:Uncharacterized protein n=1 Tax=Melipona quadrifasciata TaxID=166423 RepID=A0A0M9A4S1_9HYME|nr:hypothetical protein WN51_10307 [Melipona quadrifasciata]